MIESEELPEQFIIPISKTPVIEHISRLRCGAYTSEWVAVAMGLDVKSSNEIFKEESWKDLLRPMLPLTVLKLLEERGLQGISTSLSPYVDEQKLFWLRHELFTKKKPVLVLIKTSTLHWIVVAGYDNRRQIFFVYDPNFGRTSINEDVPIGNKEIAYGVLLEEWSGSMIFKYNVLVISTNTLLEHKEAAGLVPNQKESEDEDEDEDDYNETESKRQLEPILV